MSIHWEPLRKIIDANQSFVLSSHVRPDADAIGSEMGLAGLLEAKGKRVRIVNPSAIAPRLTFLDPQNRIKKLGEGATAEDILDNDVHIIVDTSAWAQLADVGKLFRSTPATKVVIDHHARSDDIGAVEFKDETAEATGALIFHMARALDYPLTAEIATPLFCAIATDTGWFRFPATSSDTMRTIGDLIDLGAQPNLLYERLYDQCSIGRVKLAGRVLSRVTVENEGSLAYTWVALDDFAETGSKPVDTEDLVNECLRIEGTQCAFIAVEQPNKKVKFSFRSRTGFDVAQIAEQFGGGGHKQAAGAVLPGTLSATKNQVLAALRATVSG